MSRLPLRKPGLFACGRLSGGCRSSTSSGRTARRIAKTLTLQRPRTMSALPELTPATSRAEIAVGGVQLATAAHYSSVVLASAVTNPPLGTGRYVTQRNCVRRQAFCVAFSHDAPHSINLNRRGQPMRQIIEVTNVRSRDSDPSRENARNAWWEIVPEPENHQLRARTRLARRGLIDLVETGRANRKP
jgi:hypothetical protein